MPRDLTVPAPPPPGNAPSAAGAPATLAPCANCGVPMHGPYCYACGQPARGMIRQLSSVLADFADSVFDLDSRLLRTLVPLFFRPGWLTREYFAGRRVRYVTPFRLFFFLCIIAIFAIQVTIRASGGFRIEIGNEDIAAAVNQADLGQRTAATIARIERKGGDPAAMARAIEDVHSRAAKRLEWIQQRDAALIEGRPPPPDPNLDFFRIAGQPWDPQAHPLVVSWLPAFANRELNEMIGHVRTNLSLAAHDPGHLFNAIFPVLPQTLFVMLPLFAVLLKVTYLFKRRLYMEHLIVALHSHAFIFLALLLITLVQGLLQWVTTPSVLVALEVLRGALWVWLPLYLLMMQKRVYAQGWTMTVIKYGFVGYCYLFLLVFAVAAAVLISLAGG